MTYHVILPVIIAFAVSALLGPVVIPFLRRLKVGQTERKELATCIMVTLKFCPKELVARLMVLSWSSV